MVPLLTTLSIANFYGDSEDLLGKWFAANPDKRADVFLATKYAARMKDPDAAVAADNVLLDTSPEWTKKSCSQALDRLKTDYIDLFYVHRMDGKTPIELTVRAMAELVKEGKIRHIGLSEVSAATLRRAHAVHPITAVQVEYSPFSLEIEDPQIALLSTCRELGIAVVAYSPVGRGMLTGAVRSRADMDPSDTRLTIPRFSEENFPKNLALVDKIVDLARARGVTPAQLTLAWLLAQGDDIFPIPGTTNPGRLEENNGGASISLTDEEVATIRKACDKAVVGLRVQTEFAFLNLQDSPPLEE